MNVKPHIKPWLRWLRRHYFCAPQLIALCVAGPLAWMAFDRTPPLALYDGKVTPSVVHKWQQDVEVTWHATFSGRDCPGLTQRELVDSQRSIWPQLRRARQGVFIPGKDNPLVGTVTTPPLSIPDMAAGPATYKVTQFYYCNILQWVLDWPITQPSPYIRFEVAP